MVTQGSKVRLVTTAENCSLSKMILLQERTVWICWEIYVLGSSSELLKHLHSMYLQAPLGGLDFLFIIDVMWLKMQWLRCFLANSTQKCLQSVHSIFIIKNDGQYQLAFPLKLEETKCPEINTDMWGKQAQIYVWVCVFWHVQDRLSNNHLCS